MFLGELIRFHDGSAWAIVSYVKMGDGEYEVITLKRLKQHDKASKQVGPAAFVHDDENCERCYKEPKSS